MRDRGSMSRRRLLGAPGVEVGTLKILGRTERSTVTCESRLLGQCTVNKGKKEERTLTTTKLLGSRILPIDKELCDSLSRKRQDW